jgi:hypothetical protein
MFVFPYAPIIINGCGINGSTLAKPATEVPVLLDSRILPVLIVP